jgi:hypothetical protein
MIGERNDGEVSGAVVPLPGALAHEIREAESTRNAWEAAIALHSKYAKHQRTGLNIAALSYWYGLFAPAGRPPKVVESLDSQTRTILATRIGKREVTRTRRGSHLGFEIPALNSTKRQLLLASFGILLLVSVTWPKLAPSVNDERSPTSAPRDNSAREQNERSTTASARQSESVPSADVQNRGVVSGSASKATPREADAQEKAVPPQKRDYSGIDPDEFGPRLWANGETLRIGFMDGSEEERGTVKSAAEEWMKHANIRFQVVVGASDATIRITFKQPGAWSYLGSDALQISPSKPTMVLGYMKQLPAAQAKGIALHELGHALGLIHENKIPNADISWNRKVLEAKFGVEEADRQFMSRERFPKAKEFDPNSIMMIQTGIPSAYTIDGSAYPARYELSNADRRFIARAYPR